MFAMHQMSFCLHRAQARVSDRRERRISALSRKLLCNRGFFGAERLRMTCGKEAN
jgi:hypothetical protein